MAEPEAGTYFSHTRSDLVEALGRHRPSSVVDVGCADGSTGLLLKQRFPGCHVAGVEPSGEAAETAAARLDEFYRSPVEQLPFERLAGRFDTMLLGDVLEHLVDPWATLGRLRQLLAPGGVVVATMPNVRNWRVVRDLALRGRWEYADAGIMDRTHLRFFTREGILGLFTQAGLRVEHVEAVVPRRAAVVDRLTARLLTDLLAQKFLLRARLGEGPDR